jgi:hypothetical protein
MIFFHICCRVGFLSASGADKPDCSCPYCTVFKPRTPAGFAGSLSPGFVVETSDIPRTIAAGRIARLNLLLLGRGEEALPWLWSALLHCGQVGIGVPEATFTIVLWANTDCPSLPPVIV